MLVWGGAGLGWCWFGVMLVWVVLVCGDSGLGCAGLGWCCSGVVLVWGGAGLG